MAMSNALSAAVSAPNYSYRAVLLVQIILANATVNLCDGVGFVTCDIDIGNGVTTQTFTSRSEVYGILTAVSAIEESLTTSAPSCQITLLSPGNDGFADLNSPLNQGGPVSVWWGIVDEATGTMVGTPELLGLFRYDFVKTTIDERSRSAQIECVTVFDRMFVADEGLRLCSQWYQSLYPGNNFFGFNIEAATQPFWGTAIPTPTFPILYTAPTTNDQLAGNTSGGRTSGNVWGTGI